MSLSPDYKVVIQITNDSIKVFSATIVNYDAIEAIEILCRNEGLECLPLTEVVGEPLRICFSPIYEATTIAKEIERIFYKYGIEEKDTKITVDFSKDTLKRIPTLQKTISEPSV